MCADYAPGRANIGPLNRLVRLLSGAILVLFGIVLAYYLITSDTPRVLRLVVFIPFALGFLGLIEGVFGFGVLLARARRYDMR